MDVRVGFAQFDAIGASVNVGWCEFDAASTDVQCFVGWAELDCLSPNDEPVPPFRPGGGTSRYYDRIRKKYQIPVDDEPHDEREEERIIMSILLEIAKNELS